ncbi:MAG: hypothetical protein PHX10_03430 [Gallionellaceae bacterium]|nr:hypothetical protein [Gallionellaceae bacterium]
MQGEYAEMADWKQYEVAVAQFVAAIGQDAKVTHDVKIPDAHTGLPRQRDVWVQWSLGGHFPVKAMISCKYRSRPLDEQDIDHFNGEYLSSKAQVGIIYARNGFNRSAIEKSRVLGFHCCKLFRDEPPELPEMLNYGLAYQFRTMNRCLYGGDIASYGFTHWKDVFALPVGSSTVLDELAKSYDLIQNEQDPAALWGHMRSGFSVMVSVRNPGAAPLEIHLEARFTAYRAKLEFMLLNGSYNVTSGSFMGSESTPWLKIRDVDPGPGWEEVANLPEHEPPQTLIIYGMANIRQALIDYGELAL